MARGHGTATDRAPTLKTVRRHYGEGMVRTMLAMVCDRCSGSDDRATKPDMPEAAIARFFRGRGWLVDNECRSAVCPKCQEKDKVTDISAAAMKRQRQMFLLLDEHFDIEAGCYDGDWSDARIAKETGLAENVVRHARDSAYGPIKINPVIVSAGKEIAELREKVKADLAAVRQLADQTATDLQKRLDDIEAKVSRAIRGAA